MRRLPRYKIFSEGLYDEQWREDAEKEEEYLKSVHDARFSLGLDDPLSPSALLNDEESRSQILHTIMVALEVSPKAYMEYLQMLYDVKTGVRAKTQPY